MSDVGFPISGDLRPAASFGCRSRINRHPTSEIRHPPPGIRHLLLLATLGMVRLIAADPLQVIFEQASKDLSAGNFASAERGFEKVLAAAPNQVAAMGNLGVVYQRTHRPGKAMAIYKRALKVNPKDEGILLNLGLVYFKHEDYRQAMPLFERVVAINASNQQGGRQLLATCQVYLDQPQPAIEVLEAFARGQWAERWNSFSARPRLSEDQAARESQSGVLRRCSRPRRAPRRANS